MIFNMTDPRAGYVEAAYAITLLGFLLLAGSSWLAARRAEDELRKRALEAISE